MSVVSVESGSDTAAYGGLIDAIGGIAVAVLAIIGLTGFDAERMAGIATIVLGAALLIQGGTILSEYAQVYQAASATPASDRVGGDGLAAMFVVGAGGLVLGVLALLGLVAVDMTAIAVIAYGSALVLSSTSVRQLHALQSRSLQMVSSHSGHELLAGQMASGSAGIQLLTGLTATVLGILAVAGHDPVVLTLAALLVLGITVLLTGSALSSLVLSFVRPTDSHSPRV
jgi:hypothetical protein